MALSNQTTLEENRADIARLLDAGITPLRFPMPTCEICGKEAVIGAYTHTRVHHFCEVHRAEADKVLFRPGVE